MKAEVSQDTRQQTRKTHVVFISALAVKPPTALDWASGGFVFFSTMTDWFKKHQESNYPQENDLSAASAE